MRSEIVVVNDEARNVRAISIEFAQRSGAAAFDG